MATSDIIISPAPYEMEAIKQMLPDQQQLILSKFEPKIYTYSDQQLTDYLTVIISELMIHLQSNHMNDADMVKILSQGAVNELKLFRNRFTLSDARIALNEGYRGSFGEQFYQMSQVNFSKCFRYYENWSKRLEANGNYSKIINAPKTTDCPLKLSFKVGQRECEILFEDFKKSKPETKDIILFTAFLHYDFLKQKGMFNFTDEEKRSMLKHSRQTYWLDQKRKGIPESVLQKLKTTSDNKNISIVNEAKRIAVKRYFTDLITSNKKLEFNE